MGFYRVGMICRVVLAAGTLAAALGVSSTEMRAQAAPVVVPVAGVPGAGAPATTTVVQLPVPLLPEHAGGLTGSGLIAKNATEITTELVGGPGCELAGGSPQAGSVQGGLPVAAVSAGSCLAVLKEDGLRRLAAGTYATGGGAGVPVTAFEFVDATGAYSAYTFYRSMMKNPRLTGAEARLGKLAGETSSDAGSTLVWAGTALLQVKGRVAAGDLSALVVGLPKTGGRKGLAPLLPTYLPTLAGGARIDPETVRYALGPAGYQAMGGVLPAGMLSWEKSAEAATASYAGRGGKGTLTLLLYPTPQIAGDRGRAVEKAVNEAGLASFGMVKMRRVGPLVGMTSGGLTAAQAQSLVAALHLNEEVTFDQKMPLEFHAEVRKTATLLQNIAIFSGILILAAILLGLFLGGARAGIRVLQGKPAASEPEFLTINLRDKPKALFVKKDPEPGEGQG